MRVSIERSELTGSVRAPSSKSQTIRALMCAALARGRSEIVYPLSADDTEAAVGVLRGLGIAVDKRPDRWHVVGDTLQEPRGALFCRESAATLRFATALCALVPGTSRLLAAPGLARRPIEPLLQALRQAGVNCWREDASSSVVVNGGRLRGGTVSMAGDISSQFVSALLLVAPLAAVGLRLVLTTGVESRPFLLMTLDSLRRFGLAVWHTPDLAEFHVRPQQYTPVSYNVEGDWTAASHLLSLAALAGEVRVENLRLDSTQGDRVVCNLLRQMGASVGSNGDSVSVRRSGLRAVEVDLSDCIDLLPSVAVLAAVADGVTELAGISRARLKESNRVFAVRQGLERMGIEVREESDRLKIRGSVPRGAVVDSHDDHRIAMAFTALGLRIGNTVVEGAESVSKTFPDFWEAVKDLGGRVVLHE